MLKRYIKLVLELVLIAFFCFCLLQYKTAIYGFQQGKGQVMMIWDARPIDEVLADTSFPDSLKRKLELIQEIKQFTVDSLGMNPSKNYSSVFDQKNQATLLTVSACEPFAFEPKQWDFPFLGTVPYKGFFDKNEARKEILWLKGNGYDVDVYSPSGWSTLGWFNDPVLSSMLYRSDGSLANLIIHELTHGTLFVKDNVDFNENLANFIGDKGAERFLIQKYGKDSKEYFEYEQGKADEKIFDDYILKSCDRLDSLYKTMNVKQGYLLKKEKKEQLIKEIVIGVNRLPLYNKKNYFRYSLQAFSEGNAFFMSFTRYDSQYELFNKPFTESYHSDLKLYLESLKKQYPSL